ncbi:MAG: hypothetical protein LWW87_12365 [Geobacteraceae bacterium]|nr:hypothetical protein [Geobacteraceae bacterium]
MNKSKIVLTGFLTVISLTVTSIANSMAVPVHNYDNKNLKTDPLSKTVISCKHTDSPFNNVCATKIILESVTDKSSVVELFGSKGGTCSQNPNTINCKIYVYKKILRQYLFAKDENVGGDSFYILYSFKLGSSDEIIGVTVTTQIAPNRGVTETTIGEHSSHP